MAQIIKLRRSTILGKVPTTASMYVGEVALNTYDGRAFLYKSGSAESIEQLVVTNSETTGSITILGTGSFGEINVTNDINLSGSIFGLGDVVVSGDIDAIGDITGSNIKISGNAIVLGSVSSSTYYGDGSQLTGIQGGDLPTNNFDFNIPDNAQISDFNNISNAYNIDGNTGVSVGNPVNYIGALQHISGNTVIYPTLHTIDFVVDDLYAGSISSASFYTPLPITASGLHITGNLDISGKISSSLIPITNNAYDLGSATNYWKEIFVSTGSINFVDSLGIVSTIKSAQNGGIKIGNVLITTASIAFIDNNGNVTQNIAASSSAGSTSGNNNFATTGSNTFIGDQNIVGAVTASMFSGSLYGIGDILVFSGSLATRLATLEAGVDAGQF